MTAQKNRGIALLVMSSFFFALMSAFVRMSGELPFFQKVLFRNAVAMVSSGMVLLFRHIPVRVPRECRLPLMLRIVCGMIGVFCNYYAIDHLMLANSNFFNKLSRFLQFCLRRCFSRNGLAGYSWDILLWRWLVVRFPFSLILGL